MFFTSMQMLFLEAVLSHEATRAVLHVNAQAFLCCELQEMQSMNIVPRLQLSDA